MTDRKVEIELRGQKFVCVNLTDDHAMFFGTLLMDEEELAVFVDEEDPDRAFQMMSERIQKEMAEVKASMVNATADEVDDAINLNFSKKTAARLMVRINQDRDPLNNGNPGLRLRLAARLREIFPTLPKAWVSEKGINLDLQEVITAIAVPFYSFLAREEDKELAETPKVEPTPPAPVVPPAILLPEIQQEIKPVANAGITLSADQLSELPPELLVRLGVK